MKGAVGIGATTGFINGVGSCYILQTVHTDTIRKQLQEQGYRFMNNRVIDGKIFAEYGNGSESTCVPCPDLGEALSAGLMQGIMMAFAAKKEYIKNKPNPSSSSPPQSQPKQQTFNDEIKEKGAKEGSP